MANVETSLRDPFGAGVSTYLKNWILAFARMTKRGHTLFIPAICRVLREISKKNVNGT